MVAMGGCVMKSRFLLLTLASFLAVTLLACSSKPPGSDTGNAASSGNPATPGSSGGGMAGGSSAMKSEAARATLVNPVEVEGKPAIPAGATATGTVVAAHAAGKFKGASLLEIRLDSVTVGGKPYAIQTSAVEREQKGKGKRSAAMIGGGAGAGALIGALAGGGKGAAIGALVGGGAGTAGAAYTGKADVTLPAESALSFRLTAPLELKP